MVFSATGSQLFRTVGENQSHRIARDSMSIRDKKFQYISGKVLDTMADQSEPRSTLRRLFSSRKSSVCSSVSARKCDLEMKLTSESVKVVRSEGNDRRGGVRGSGQSCLDGRAVHGPAAVGVCRMLLPGYCQDRWRTSGSVEAPQNWTGMVHEIN